MHANVYFHWRSEKKIGDGSRNSGHMLALFRSIYIHTIPFSSSVTWLELLVHKNTLLFHLSLIRSSFPDFTDLPFLSSRCSSPKSSSSPPRRFLTLDRNLIWIFNWSYKAPAYSHSLLIVISSYYCSYIYYIKRVNYNSRKRFPSFYTYIIRASVC